MVVPIGGLGDVAAIIHILTKTVKALDETRGSAAEYRKTVARLWQLDKVLSEIEGLCRPIEGAPRPSTVDSTICEFTHRCRQRLEVFLRSLRKFAPHLREGGSGNSLKDAPKKIQWHYSRSSKLEKFWEEIRNDCSFLAVLLSVASENERRLDAENVVARIEDTREKMVNSIDEQQLVLTDIKQQLQDARQQIITAISSSFSLAYIRSMSSRIQKFMQGIYVTTYATYQMVRDIHGCLPGHLERVLIQEPFILEDVHGRVKPIYMDCISSWGAFDAWLEYEFRGLPSHAMVSGKYYVLHDSTQNSDILCQRPWDKCFLPGQKIVMDMIVPDLKLPRRCPSCNLDVIKADEEVRCERCNICYPYFNTTELAMALVSHASSYRHVSVAPKHYESQPVSPLKRVRMISLVDDGVDDRLQKARDENQNLSTSLIQRELKQRYSEIYKQFAGLGALESINRVEGKKFNRNGVA